MFLMMMMTMIIAHGTQAINKQTQELNERIIFNHMTEGIHVPRRPCTPFWIYYTLWVFPKLSQSIQLKFLYKTSRWKDKWALAE